MMIRTFLLSCALVGMPAAQTGNGSWSQEFAAAKARAKAENKLLLVHFGGSDSNSWSITMARDVFSKPDFRAQAAKNFVLVLIDFPRRTKLPQALADQNARLKQQYSIKALPVFAVMDHEGHVIDEISRNKDVAPFLADMAASRARAARFTSAKEAARKLSGLARAEGLVMALLELDPTITRRHHVELMKEIVALDADGTGGLKARYGHRLKQIAESRDAARATKELRLKVQGAQRAGKLADAIQVLEQEIAKPKDRIWQQQAMLMKAQLLRVTRRNLDTAVELLQQLRKLAPNSPSAKQADLLLPGIRREAERAREKRQQDGK